MRLASDRMRPERRITLVLLSICFAYVLCAGSVLFLYVHAHPGAPVPRFISVPILCLFVLTIGGGAFVTNRMARRLLRTETAEQGHLRRLRAIKGLKVGLIVWGLILLNDVRMLAEGSIPWKYAIPGLIVVALIVAVCWKSLMRLKRIEATGSEPDHSHTPRP